MFFKNFPKTVYSIDNGNIIIPDLFRRVAPNEKISDSFLMDLYYVKDGETPESISYDFYDTVEFYWTILLVNEIIDPYHDWPRSQGELYDWAVEKYGTTHLNDPNHYIVSTSDIPAKKKIRTTFDSTKLNSGEIVAVTNFEYEREENEKKRNINLVKPSLIRDFAGQFAGIIST